MSLKKQNPEVNLKHVVLDNFQTTLAILDRAKSGIKDLGGNTEGLDCSAIDVRKALELFREDEFDNAANMLLLSSKTYGFSKLATLGLLIKQYIIERPRCSEFILQYCRGKADGKCKECTPYLKERMESYELELKWAPEWSLQKLARMAYAAHLNDGKWPETDYCGEG